MGVLGNLLKVELRRCQLTQDSMHTLGDILHRCWNEEMGRAADDAERALMTTRSLEVSGNDLSKTMRTRQWTTQAINIREITLGTTVAAEIVPLLEAAAQLSAVLHYRNKRIRNRAAILRSIVYTFRFERRYQEAFLGTTDLVSVSSA